MLWHFSRQIHEVIVAKETLGFMFRVGIFQKGQSGNCKHAYSFFGLRGFFFKISSKSPGARSQICWKLIVYCSVLVSLFNWEYISHLILSILLILGRSMQVRSIFWVSILSIVIFTSDLKGVCLIYLAIQHNQHYLCQSNKINFDGLFYIGLLSIFSRINFLYIYNFYLVTLNCS